MREIIQLSPIASRVENEQVDILGQNRRPSKGTPGIANDHGIELHLVKGGGHACEEIRIKRHNGRLPCVG